MWIDLCWFHQVGLTIRKRSTRKKSLASSYPGWLVSDLEMQDLQGSLETGDVQGFFFHAEE